MKYFRVIRTVAVSALCLLPFFWLGPGEIDLGGDSTRLYFWDAISYAKNVAFFSVDLQGINAVVPNQYILPYLMIQQVINWCIGSAHVVVALEKSLKLAGGFWFMYLFVREVAQAVGKKHRWETYEIPALAAGIIYVFAPAHIYTMPNALLTHNQMFLNPLMAYLFIKIVKLRDMRYVWLALLVTMLFPANFTLAAPQILLAFYPFLFFFLYVAARSIYKKTIPWLHVFVGIFVFVALHAYHIFPRILNAFDPQSYIHIRATESLQHINRGLQYFIGILPLAKVSPRVLLATNSPFSVWTSWIFFFFALLGLFFWRTKKQKHVLIACIAVYLSLLYLVSANITHAGVLLYERFFAIPGFSMFRNFMGQFQYAYEFFFATFVGISLAVASVRIKKKYIVLAVVCMTAFVVIRSWDFVSGRVIDSVHRDTAGIRTAFIMDPKYLQTLDYIRKLPDDGKILSLPLTDYFSSVVRGANGGAYISTSLIPLLTGKSDFPAYQMLQPFAEDFMAMSRTEDVNGIQALLSLLNVRYIFHNSDKGVYDDAFLQNPYPYMRSSLPVDQKGYTAYIEKLTTNKIYKNGPYILYDLGSGFGVGSIFLPERIHIYADASGQDDFISLVSDTYNQKEASRTVYMSDVTCAQIMSKSRDCAVGETVFAPHTIGMSYAKINPTKYLVTLTNVSSPFIIALSTQYNSSWGVYVSDGPDSKKGAFRWISGMTKSIFGDDEIFASQHMRQVARDTHIKVQGYANGWYIRPGMLDGKTSVTLIVETSSQKVFYKSAVISIIAVIAFGIWGAAMLFCRRKVV